MGMLFNSCSGQQEKAQYYRFSRQLTPSGKYVIYDYAREGKITFFPDVLGTEVFGINQAFEEGQGEGMDGSISQWISDDTLLVYDFTYPLKQPRDTLPIKTQLDKVGDFIVKKVFYKSNSRTGSTYSFDSVYASKDSLFIRLLPQEEGRLLTLQLGGTHVKVKADSIYAIEIQTRMHKSMDFERTFSDGTTQTGLPRIEVESYYLIPIKKISPSLLPEKKVFWEK
jgi:hypothetical protein